MIDHLRNLIHVIVSSIWRTESLFQIRIYVSKLSFQYTYMHASFSSTSESRRENTVRYSMLVYHEKACVCASVYDKLKVWSHLFNNDIVVKTTVNNCWSEKTTLVNINPLAVTTFYLELLLKRSPCKQEWASPINQQLYIYIQVGHRLHLTPLSAAAAQWGLHRVTTHHPSNLPLETIESIYHFAEVYLHVPCMQWLWN